MSKPLDNIMEQMGITEDDLEALSGEIGSLSDLNDLVPAGSDGTDDDAPHETDPVAAGARRDSPQAALTMRPVPVLPARRTKSVNI